MGSLAAISLCVLLALTLYDGVDGDDSSHNIQAIHVGGGVRYVIRPGLLSLLGGDAHGRRGGHVHGGRTPPPRPQPPPPPPQGGDYIGYFKKFSRFLKLSPMFHNVQTQNRQLADNYIRNSINQRQDLMKDISVFHHGKNVNTRVSINNIQQPTMRVSSRTKINFNLGSLFAGNPKAQAHIQIYLDKLSKDEQQIIFADFRKLGRKAQIEYLLHLSGFNKGQSGNDSIIGESEGGGGSTTTVINLTQLFPNERELQGNITITINGDPITINNESSVRPLNW